jgi:hypothetical protein
MESIGVISASRKLPLAVAVVVAGILAGAALPAAADKKFTLYAVATTAQFMNHADDRLRGMTTNPFNIAKAQALVITTKGKEKGNGPFPGDDILYSFELYSDPQLRKRAGSAMFTCYFSFAKRAAILLTTKPPAPSRP